MPVYIEHANPHNPSKLRRYDDMPAAAMGISNATRFSSAMILAELRSRGRFTHGNDSWSIMTAKEMRERAAYASLAAKRIQDGDDVADLPD